RRRPDVGELSRHRPAHAAGRFSRGAQARQRRRRDLHRGAFPLHRPHRRARHRLMMLRRLIVVALALFTVVTQVAAAQNDSAKKVPNALERAAQARADKKISEKYDPMFRKYTKRFFGPAFDWKYFKAQGFAESGLKASAKSWVGARGVMQLMPSTYQ